VGEPDRSNTAGGGMVRSGWRCHLSLLAETSGHGQSVGTANPGLAGGLGDPRSFYKFLVSVKLGL